MKLSDQVLDQLRLIDTPTIVNSIEVVQGSRGFRNYTRGNLVATQPDAGPFLGHALTARIRAKSPSEDSLETLRNRKIDYYRYLASGQFPSIIVIEDLDHPDIFGAWWGEVNSTVHKALGLAGAITNGSVRDFDQLADEFPILAGEIGVSHAHVHIIDFDVPVRVLGMNVEPGDLIHADRHGAAVIPGIVAEELPRAVQELEEREALIIKPAKYSQEYDIDVLIASLKKFEEFKG